MLISAMISIIYLKKIASIEFKIKRKKKQKNLLEYGKMKELELRKLDGEDSMLLKENLK